jgi:hypothetical protein
MSAPARSLSIPRWRVGQALLTLAVLAFLGWTLLSFGALAEVLRTAAALRAHPELLALFFVSYSAAFWLRAVGWQNLLPTRVGVGRLFGLLQSALLANHLFPTKVGELVRVALLTRAGVALPVAAASTAVARTLDLAALCALAVVFRRGSLSALSNRLPRPAADLTERARMSLATLRGPQVAMAGSLSVASWLLEATALWSVAWAAEVPLSPQLAVAATAFTIAFQGFQVTPGGIGLYEASLTAVLSAAGIDPTQALGLAVATHALKFGYAYAAGLPSLALEAARQDGSRLAALLRPWAGRRAVAMLGVGLVFAVAVTQVGVLPAVLAAGALVPWIVLARGHHLPKELVALLALPWLVVGAIGPLTLPIALAAAGLHALGALIAPRVLHPLGWLVGLAAVGLAALASPLPVGLVGLASLTFLVLARQRWAARHPLPLGEPLAGGRVVVLIPVHNEAESIGAVLESVAREKLVAYGLEPTVLVVDDGSSDRSAEAARAAGADVVIRHSERRGLGAAVRTGLREARQRDAVAVVYLDGDGEYDPAEVARVLRPVVHGQADYVLGNRFPGAADTMIGPRLAGNRVFTLLVSLLSGVRVQDGQTGYRAFGPRALAAAEIIHDYNYAQVLTLDLVRKGMRLAEVPVSYRRRTSGRSFVRYGEYGRKVLPAIVRELLAA